MSKERNVIIISFKNTAEDIELYNYWNNIDGKSIEIKKLLRIAMFNASNNTKL